MYYLQENYDSAYYYFRIFVNVREANKLGIYLQENVKIARVFSLMGHEAEAEKLFSEYVTYCEEDQTPYRSINWVWKYAYEGKI